jgi:hypothetical protein
VPLNPEAMSVIVEARSTLRMTARYTHAADESARAAVEGLPSQPRHKEAAKRTFS